MVEEGEKSFRAGVMVRQNAPLEVVSLERVAPAAGQVAVRMITAALCGAQWNEISGVKGPDRFLPHMMGHEGFGEVVSIGPEVKKVKPGDMVVLHWRKGSGADCCGPRYDSPIGKVGSGPVTTFAELTIVAENRTTPVEYEADLRDVYPLLGCALSTSWGLLAKEAKVQTSDSLLISGAGGVGLATGLLARIMGLGRVEFFDRVGDKRAFAEELGCAYHSGDAGASLAQLPAAFDVVVETTGDPQNISDCFERLKPGGQLVLVGQPRVGTMVQFKNFLKMFDGMRMYSSSGGSFFPDDDMPRLLSLISKQKSVVRRLVSHVIRLEDVNEGFQLMQAGHAMRVVIDCETGV